MSPFYSLHEHQGVEVQSVDLIFKWYDRLISFHSYFYRLEKLGHLSQDKNLRNGEVNECAQEIEAVVPLSSVTAKVMLLSSEPVLYHYYSPFKPLQNCFKLNFQQ